MRYPQLKSCQFQKIVVDDQGCQLGEKKTLGDFYFESGCHDNTTPHNKKADDTTFSRLGTWKQNFFQRQACFKNWQHWSSTTIPSIWHLSVGGLRVGPISSTGAYGAMSLLLLILRDSTNVLAPTEILVSFTFILSYYS